MTKRAKSKTPSSHTVQAPGRISLAKAEYCRIRVKDIRVRPEHSVTDDVVVSSIAESFIVTGQIHPVVVRRTGSAYELVWGADVLAAAHAARVKWIECRLFVGNDDEARLLQIAEALFRKELTALEKAKHWADWADTVLRTKGLFSGQPVSKRGRPDGDLLKAARLLPAIGGRTAKARKKMLARAFKIARLPSDVKAAIESAGLDNNQSVLLAIASAGDAEAQHRKLDQLQKKLAEIPEIHLTTSDKDEQDDSDGVAPIQLDELKDEDEEATNYEAERRRGIESDGVDNASAPLAVSDTDFLQLRSFWKVQGGRELWAQTPSEVRKEFVDWLTRRRCGANSDIGRYVKDVFAGRKHILVRVLKAHARSLGLSEKKVREYLKLNGYVRRRRGRGPLAPQVYKNRDPDFDGFSGITQQELEAPYNSELDALNETVSQQTPSNLLDGSEGYYEN